MESICRGMNSSKKEMMYFYNEHIYFLIGQSEQVKQPSPEGMESSRISQNAKYRDDLIILLRNECNAQQDAVANKVFSSTSTNENKELTDLRKEDYYYYSFLCK
jgi:hypothetical protein